MTTNQESRHAKLHDAVGEQGPVNSDWHEYWTDYGIADGTFNERMILWINDVLGASYSNINEAMSAYAIDGGFSNWSSMNELADVQVATPVFSPVAGGYVTSQNVTITCATPSSTIYYTTDGSTPTTGSTVYSSPVAISSTTTLKAFAVAAGLPDSSVQTGVYTISDGISVAATVLTPTTADITISGVDVDNGTFYIVVVLAAATAPSAAQIEAGTDGSDAAAVWDDVRSVLDTNDVTVEAFGLSGVAHIAYAVQKDSSGNYTSVANSGSFTPADVTAPVLSSAEGASTGTTTADLDVNTDTAEGELYVVVTQSSTAPSAAQVKAGQDHTSTAADFADSDLAIVASGPHSFSATGLTADTTYYVYFMHEDDAGNQSTVLAGAASFTTDAGSGTTVFSYADDGTTTGLFVVTAASLAGSQSDSDGGTDAISITDTNPGTTGSFNIRTTNETVNSGDNLVQAKFKTVSSSASKMWVAIGPVSQTVTGNAWFDITDDATPVGSRVGTTAAAWSATSVTSLGSGWFQVQGTFDATGADVTGQWYVQFADADNDASVLRDGTNVVRLHDFVISYT